MREVQARIVGAIPALFVLVGFDLAGASCLDVGDSAGRAISISSDGWSIVEQPPACGADAGPPKQHPLPPKRESTHRSGICQPQ